MFHVLQRTDIIAKNIERRIQILYIIKYIDLEKLLHIPCSVKPTVAQPLS